MFNQTLNLRWKKKDNSKNNLQESSATNVGEHAPCG